MHDRDLESMLPEAPPAPPSYPNLTLRTPPNWTAVAFLVLLAALHLSVAGRAFVAGRWEGYVSLCFGTLFAVAAVVTFHVRREVAVLYHHGKLRLRTGVGPLSAERCVPFRAVRAVRVTLGPSGGSARDSCVELICPDEDVPCPPTAVPRQLGLLLALMTGAPLVKVSADPPPAPAGRARQPAAPAAPPGKSSGG